VVPGPIYPSLGRLSDESNGVMLSLYRKTADGDFKSRLMRLLLKTLKMIGSLRSGKLSSKSQKSAW
jgi:hypothetical protein